jgi:glycosyltransferase involved in cell wall biosynthesis
MPPAPAVSVIVPARNEEAQIGGTLDAILAAAAALAGRDPHDLRLEDAGVEVIVVDDESTDGTAAILRRYADRHGVRVLRGTKRSAPSARNTGVAAARGSLLLFVDADTRVHRDTLIAARRHVDRGALVGLFGLVGQDRGLRSALWWAFWDAMRRLPVAEAKAMPAAMFCTRAAFDRFGPFDESVVIGEEWPLTAGCYRACRGALVVDRAARAASSNRRMALRPCGYARTFGRYVWAVLHASGRRDHPDTVREAPPNEKEVR